MRHRFSTGYPRRMDRPTSDSTGSHDEQASGELDPLTDLGTWSALLGHWSALVKAGEGLVLAAPDDADAARWRASIPEVISLQSITFALRDLARLPEADRPLARDRADLTVTASASSLALQALSNSSRSTAVLSLMSTLRSRTRSPRETK